MSTPPPLLSLWDEESLARAARDGNHLAFGELYRRYQPIFKAYIAPRLAHDGVADVLQSVFLNIHRGLRRYHGPRFFSWSYRICVNTVIDEQRRRRKSLPLSQAEVDEKAEVRDQGATPEEELVAKRLATHLSESLDALPAGQRAVFVLARIEGLEYSEVADLLALPIGTVKSRMFTALRALSGKRSQG